MFNQNIQESFSLLLTITYTYDKKEQFNYQKQPRPCHNFVFFVEGSGTITSNGKTLIVNKGDILFIPKNTIHKTSYNDRR